MLASGDYNQLLLFCQQALAVHPEVTDYYPYLGLAYLPARAASNSARNLVILAITIRV